MGIQKERKEAGKEKEGKEEGRRGERRGGGKDREMAERMCERMDSEMDPQRGGWVHGELDIWIFTCLRLIKTMNFPEDHNGDLTLMFVLF